MTSFNTFKVYEGLQLSNVVLDLSWPTLNIRGFWGDLILSCDIYLQESDPPCVITSGGPWSQPYLQRSRPQTTTQFHKILTLLCANDNPYWVGLDRPRTGSNPYSDWIWNMISCVQLGKTSSDMLWRSTKDGGYNKIIFQGSTQSEGSLWGPTTDQKGIKGFPKER